MTDLRKAAEMALEALEDASERLSLEFTGRSEYEEEIAVLRQTLSQLEREQHCRYCNGIGRVVCDGRCLPKQEAVAFEDWLKNQHGDPEEIGFLQALRVTYYAGADSRTAPPSKSWVSLTGDEIKQVFIDSWKDTSATDYFARAIESKLKEKNA